MKEIQLEDSSIKHRCVWVLALQKASYAVRLLVYENEVALRRAHGWGVSYLYGAFVWAPKNRRLGQARWLGSVCLALDNADIDTIFHEVCHVAQRLHQSGHTHEECAHVCGQLGAAVCEEFQQLGIALVPSKDEADILERREDRWDLCHRNQLLGLYPDDPDVEPGDALD